MANSTRFPVAVHILVALTVLRNEFVSSETISQSVDTNAVVIRRILSALQKADLVTSQPGVTGGARLNRDPERITLLEVYKIVEGGSLFPFHHPNEVCPIGSRIRQELEPVFQASEGAMEDVLGGVTIADVVKRVTRRSRRKAG